MEFRSTGGGGADILCGTLHALDRFTAAQRVPSSRLRIIWRNLWFGQFRQFNLCWAGYREQRGLSTGRQRAGRPTGGWSTREGGLGSATAERIDLWRLGTLRLRDLSLYIEWLRAPGQYSDGRQVLFVCHFLWLWPDDFLPVISRYFIATFSLASKIKSCLHYRYCQIKCHIEVVRKCCLRIILHLHIMFVTIKTILFRNHQTILNILHKHQNGVLGEKTEDE